MKKKDAAKTTPQMDKEEATRKCLNWMLDLQGHHWWFNTTNWWINQYVAKVQSREIGLGECARLIVNDPHYIQEVLEKP